MRAYIGTVDLNNGKFARTYRVVVYASNWHVAMLRATQVAQRELKTHLRKLGINRPHVEHMRIMLDQGARTEKGVPLLDRAILS